MQQARTGCPKSSYRYKDRENKRAKEMTYILGSRCSDGVVMIADRKFTVDYGSSYLYDDKVFQIVDGIVVAFAGSRGVFELFDTQLDNRIVEDYKQSQEPTIAQSPFILKVSEIMYGLNNRYSSSEDRFDALIAMGGAPSSLKLFYPDGRVETVTGYKAIGTGAPYGSIFLHKLWHQSMTMEQVAELGYFIIRYIQETELDFTVGVNKEYPHPDIWFLPDTLLTPGSSVRPANRSDDTLLAKIAEKTALRLDKHLKSLVKDYCES